MSMELVGDCLLWDDGGQGGGGHVLLRESHFLLDGRCVAEMMELLSRWNHCFVWMSLFLSDCDLVELSIQRRSFLQNPTAHHLDLLYYCWEIQSHSSRRVNLRDKFYKRRAKWKSIV